MAPAEDREIQIKILVNAREKRMLDDLTEADGVTVADYLRGIIRHEHGQRFRSEYPGDAHPTRRGIIVDVVGPPHYTAGNIASRTKLTLHKVLEVLGELQKKGVVQRLDGQGAMSSWESRVIGLEKTLALAESKGFELDTDLRD